ncbi:sugar phosphate isomerase/epimerase family protein [Mycolicibacterium sp.]|uniref:sugar phosphate isomerase/epimerase family protein n=1 Tax=Mycolicibacterium sp. TaxID=2320850 RepID=UPI0037CB19DD
MNADVIAACWTTAGAAAPEGPDDRSPVPICERVEAAAQAGFTGFGIRHADLLAVEDGMGFTNFRRLLDDHGMRHLEIEFLEDWYKTGDLRTRSDLQREDLLRAADSLGVTRIKVGCHMRGGSYDVDRVAEELALLGDQAARVGTIIGVEPMPFADIQTPAAALEIVVKAGNPSAGVFLDLWHVGRAGIDMQSLSEIPAEYIAGVELADADREIRGGLFNDTINHRRFPGEGSLDAVGFIKSVAETGYSGPWGVEMLSIEFREMPVQTAAKRAYESTARLLRNYESDRNN